MTKPIEEGVARALRAEHGTPVKELARLLQVSAGTISVWVRDIEIDPEQMRRNMSRSARAATWSAVNRERRRGYQEEGRRRARPGDLQHMAGCMLYWAEGSKGRNSVVLTNSDGHMLRYFARFLRETFEVPSASMAVRLNVYLGNGLSLAQVEEHWLELLDLDRSSLRKHAINHFPTSTSGRKRTLPYGVCTLRVLRSTRLVQHIYGAIQEYAGFDEPRWLDGLY